MTLKFCFTHIRHHTICILSSTWAISGHVGDMNSLLWRHQERQSGSESPGSCGLISVLWGQPELRTRVWERSSLSMCELVRNHVKAKRIDGNTHFGGFMAHERESPLRVCVCVCWPATIHSIRLGLSFSFKLSESPYRPPPVAMEKSHKKSQKQSHVGTLLLPSLLLELRHRHSSKKKKKKTRKTSAKQSPTGLESSVLDTSQLPLQ